MNRPTPWHHPKRLGALAVTWAMLAQAVMPAHAVSVGSYDGFVAQLPGVYTAPPDVNVMFTLDDSGSMLSDGIPDYATNVANMPQDNASAALCCGFGSQFPAMWANGSAWRSNAQYASTSGVVRFMRSSAGNPLYYDPKVTYRPWPTAANDKVLNANANPVAVNIHGTDPFNTGTTINLKVNVGYWPAT